ncbi:hypothetical protein HN419_05325 [Candidatus Woesearchaeota archaeon]|jgi:hypothetical protein|nr:hypothetical protein [Candidatus Woesearchaeota archaeon]MBT3537707.1 hypothetical protein [Candidatus Woesearchaeota archaeon]MBT4697838.1 hypothetical protein [Candidatus Woesearchaeota archaeon]MBT4717501.1 hypothetical protein [Candidatus Woesearchaeota archaeon]MBT7105376.1 hypothetical protein [Candidatus Woesearchaeota archaeon]
MGVISFITHRLLSLGLLLFAFSTVAVMSLSMGSLNKITYIILGLIALVSALAGAYFLKTDH